MYFRIQHVTGSKAGQQEMVPGPMITLGRDPSSTVAFDPQVDAAVSGTHAQVLMMENGTILLSDLGSSNGTWVNGAKLESPTPITTGTAFSLGEDGPQLEFHLVPVAGKMAEPAPPPTAPPVEKKKSKLPLIIGLLLVIILVVVIVVVATDDDDDDGDSNGEPTTEAEEEPGE